MDTLQRLRANLESMQEPDPLLADCFREIESIRQQLTEKVILNNQLADFLGDAEQKLAESQKREVMLRDAIRAHVDSSNNDDSAGDTFGALQEALASTDDMSVQIMCNAEPVAYMIKCKDQVMGFVQTQEKGTIPVFEQKETK
jgi:hypothetical protein